MKKALDKNKKLKKEFDKAQDRYDIDVAESRIEEKSVPFKKVINKLRKKGKF